MSYIIIPIYVTLDISYSPLKVSGAPNDIHSNLTALAQHNPLLSANCFCFAASGAFTRRDMQRRGSVVGSMKRGMVVGQKQFRCYETPARKNGRG